MTKSARRFRITPNIVSDVEDDVIRPRRVSAYTARDVIQAKIIACPPGDVVVGTRTVPADAYGSHEFAFAVIQRQSAAERLGIKIIYIPIGQLSPLALKKVRVMHVLEGHDKRQIAKDYVW